MWAVGWLVEWGLWEFWEAEVFGGRVGGGDRGLGGRLGGAAFRLAVRASEIGL